VHGEIRSPHIFAESCGDGFLAVIHELGENIVSLFQKVISISFAPLLLCFFPDMSLAYCEE
jgi:hypothetical protein